MDLIKCLFLLPDTKEQDPTALSNYRLVSSSPVVSTQSITSVLTHHTAAAAGDGEPYGVFQAAAIAAQHPEGHSTDALAAVARGRGMMEEEMQTGSQLVDLAAALESLPAEMARDSGAAWEVVRRHLQRGGEHNTGQAGMAVFAWYFPCPLLGVCTVGPLNIVAVAHNSWMC